MGATKYEWTDKTKTGLSKEEYDALWDGVNAIGDGTLDALSNVVITAVGDHDLLAWDAGTSKWINMTAAEAGINLALYLPLAGGSLTGNLMFYKDNPLIQLYDSGEATYSWMYHNGAGVSLDFSWNGVIHSRYMNATGTWELAAGVSQPTVNTTDAVSFYQDAALDELWATWKDSGATHHAAVARAKRTIVSLHGPSGYIGQGTVTYGGANGDVGLMRFPNGSTVNAVWNFARPFDWDYGKIIATIYWTNAQNNVTGNHYCPNRLVGWAVGEDIATPNGKQIFAGATTITGLNDAGKIGSTAVTTAGTYDLTTEDFFTYRWQRTGAHGSDTSGQDWEIMLITLELTTT